MRIGSPEWKQHNPGSRAGDIDNELRKIEGEAVLEKYTPSFLGEGGQHVVFEIPNHPEVVAKVDREALEATIEACLERGVPFEEPPEATRKWIERTVLENREAVGLLREYFGDAVLKERQLVMDIPMTTNLLRVVAGDHMPELSEGVRHITVPVRIQEKIPQETIEGSIDVGFQYLENSKITGEEYARLHGVLTGGLSGREYLSVFPSGKQLLAAIDEHPELVEVLKKFTNDAARYTEDTGEMLDLAGLKNALVYQGKDGKWQLRLPDALYPERYQWGPAREAMDTVVNGGDIDGPESFVLMNGLNYSRFMNALAESTGATSRLRLSHGEVADPARLLDKIRDAQRRS